MDARNNYRNFPLSNVDNRRFDPRWFNHIVKLRTGFLLRWSFAWVPGSWDGKKHPNEIWPDQPFRTMHLQHRFSDSPSFGSQFLQRNPSRYLWPVRYLEKKRPKEINEQNMARLLHLQNLFQSLGFKTSWVKVQMWDQTWRWANIWAPFYFFRQCSKATATDFWVCLVCQTQKPPRSSTLALNKHTKKI